MIELKQCPFCGGKPMLSERLNYVTCGNELCVIGNTTSVWFLPEQWNARAPTAQTARAEAAAKRIKYGVSLPQMAKVVPELLSDFSDSEPLIKDGEWTQTAVDFACLLNGTLEDKP